MDSNERRTKLGLVTALTTLDTKPKQTQGLSLSLSEHIFVYIFVLCKLVRSRGKQSCRVLFGHPADRNRKPLIFVYMCATCVTQAVCAVVFEVTFVTVTV